MPPQQGMWIIRSPDGQEYQVPADQMNSGATYQPAPKPSSGQQVGQAAGNVGGQVAGHAAYNQLFGSGSAAAPATPTVISGSQTMAPVANSGLSSSGVGAGSGYPATETLLQGGSQEGIAQGTSAAAAEGGTPWFSVGKPSYAGYAAAAYDAYNGYNNFQNADPDMQGTKFQQGVALPVADVFTGGLAGLAEGIGRRNPTTRHWLEEIDKIDSKTNPFSILWRKFGSSKGKEQLARDDVRKTLKDNGFINDNYEIELPNGNKFNIGKDGGEPWYNVDFTNPQAGGVVAAVQPLATIFAKGDKKLTNDFAGYLANAAMSGGDPMQNVLAMMEKTGMNHDQIYGAVHLLSKSQGGTLDDNLADAYKNALDQTYGVGAYQGQGSRFGTPPSNMAIPAGQMHGQEQMPGYKPRPQQQQGGEQESAPTQTTTTTPPAGQAGQAQQPTKPRGPFTVVGGQSNNGPFIAGKQRVSPGVWQDQKGQYLSKSGVRGK